MTRSARSPTASAGNTGLYLSRSVSAKQSGPKPGWLRKFGDCRRNVCTLYNHLSARPATWSSALLTHEQAYITKRHRRSSWSMQKAVTCNHEGEKTSH